MQVSDPGHVAAFLVPGTQLSSLFSCLPRPALLGVTIFNYILSFIAVVLFFVFYTTPGGCYINKFFISFNMLFCMVASVISVLPKVQVRLELLRFMSLIVKNEIAAR